MDRLRDIAAGKVRPFDASKLTDLDAADAAIGRFLLGGHAPKDWTVYRFVLEHTPWRSTEMDWFVQTPRGAFAVQGERNGVDYEDDQSHDFGLLYTGTVAAVLHVPRLLATDLPKTLHTHMTRLLAPRFGAVEGVECKEQDAFPAFAKGGGEFTTVEWTSDNDTLLGRGQPKRAVKEYLQFREANGWFFEERLLRWIDPAHAGNVGHAQTILWELAKGRGLGAKFVRRLHGDRLVAVHARQLKVVVWLESAYLDEEIREHRDFENLREGNIVVVAEDDRLIADPEKVAMRIRKPIAWKLKTPLGARAVAEDDDSEETTMPVPDPFAVKVEPFAPKSNHYAAPAPEVKFSPSSAPKAAPAQVAAPVALGSVNTVSISGFLHDDILFVEAENTGGRAEFFLDVERTYGGSRDPIPCTSFGHQALETLRKAIVGDYIVVTGEVRAFKGQVYIYAKNIVAILPVS